MQGDVVCCDSCASSYHTACLPGPLQLDQSGDWFCPACSCATCGWGCYIPTGLSQPFSIGGIPSDKCNAGKWAVWACVSTRLPASKVRKLVAHKQNVARWLLCRRNFLAPAIVKIVWPILGAACVCDTGCSSVYENSPISPLFCAWPLPAACQHSFSRQAH
jgi:PHD-finger